MPRGRQTKLSPAVQERILNTIRDGNYAVVAVAVAGIDESTYYRWLRDPRPVYREFCQSVAAAEAEAEARLVGILAAAAVTDPKLAMEVLARRFPDRWAQKQRFDVDGMLRAETTRFAAEYGLDPDELVIEAKQILLRNGY